MSNYGQVLICTPKLLQVLANHTQRFRSDQNKSKQSQHSGDVTNKIITFHQVKFLIFDEIDDMYEQKQDKDQINKILNNIKTTKRNQGLIKLICVSATLTITTIKNLLRFLPKNYLMSRYEQEISTDQVE